jgi:hypothetical protein
MDNQEYEHIQRACTYHARTTILNPIDEVHHGLALALLQTQFEHAQFQDKKSRAYETEHGGKHEPCSSSKSSLQVQSCSVRHQADMLCSWRPVQSIVSSFARKQPADMQ